MRTERYAATSHPTYRAMITSSPIFTIKTSPLFIASFLCVVFSCNIASAQVPVDMSGFEEGNAEVLHEDTTLSLTWPTGEDQKGRLIINLQEDRPLLKSMQLGEQNEFKEIASGLSPAFVVTVGKRELERNGWTVFFDNPVDRPHESYSLALDKQRAKVMSQGTRTHVTVNGANAGPFSGAVKLTVYNGSPLVKVTAEMSTEKDSVAMIYDAGLVSQSPSWEQMSWMATDDYVPNSDTKAYLHNAKVDGQGKSKNIAAKYRAIAGQTASGSVAIFPPPHQYFYPLDNAYNEKHMWYGRDYRGVLPGYGIGIRHDLLGDRRWVPWFNTPPGTKQKLSFFALLSTEREGRVLNEVKEFTHNDKYVSLPNYFTMSSHFHQEHTQDVYTHKPLPEIPGFVKAFRNTGVNIVHLAEFHGPGHPEGPEIRRFSEFEILHEEAARLSDGDFLLLPGEEPNHFFGGHWISLFPKPVYWMMSREEGEPFVEDHPKYGKIYRVSNQEEMLKLLELENGLAWTAHPRIKGSIGYPDQYKDEAFYTSDRFLGAAWKAMPADLSHAELGGRVLNLMDDMGNWGGKKNILAEADLFKVYPGYELYAHLNVNYLRMDELPEFEEGWAPVLSALRQGQFFSTTGEVLLPEFTVNGAETGETVELGPDGEANISLTVNWTFPLNYVEVISGDGEQVYKEKISLEDTKAFGSEEFKFSSIDLQNREWVRVEVWDVAANGAFTQFVWLD